MACNGSGWIGQRSCGGCKNCRGKDNPSDTSKSGKDKDKK